MANKMHNKRNESSATDEQNAEVADPTWRNLYKVGAAAALIAALVFRRNLGVAEIPLFTGTALPGTVDSWFTLLHSNPLLGLTLLNVFDIANYALVGLMFLAIYLALKPTDKRFTLIASVLGLCGMVAYFVSNSAFPMLSLSNQYATATTDAQKSTLLTAGQATLTNGYNPSAVYQSTGFYLSLLLVALAGLIMSIVMLRSRVFGKIAAYTGIMASLLDLVYIVGLVFVPETDVALLGIICIATAGLLLMIWHLLIGLRLYRLSQASKINGGVN